MEITIVSQGVHACSATWDDPQLALAWLRMLAENITPGSFLQFLSQYGDGATAEQMTNAKHMIDYCMGTGV